MKQYVPPIIWIISLQCMSAMLGYITRGGTSEWYLTIERSPLTPPNIAFPIAWTLLYILIALAGWLVWQHKSDRYYVRALFAGQLLMNWIWTPVFFAMHWTGFGALIISMIIVLVLLLIRYFWQAKRAIAYLLMPYLVWIIFALHLNAYIYFYN